MRSKPRLKTRTLFQENAARSYVNPHTSANRFSGADDFYKYKDDIEPDPVRGLAMRRTNFIPDVINCDLPLDNRRSPGCAALSRS